MNYNDPMQAQGYRTQRSDQPEDLWQPLYDRANYASAGQSTLSFFASPKGSSATLITAGAAASKSKTLRDTNIENANVVPAKMFKIYGISLAYVQIAETTSANNPADRALFRDGSYFEWKIVDKTILNIPTILIPELNPITGISTGVVAGTAQTSVVTGGQSPMYKLPVPVTLNPFENFTASIQIDGTVALSQTMDVYLIFHASMRRPT